MSNPINYLTLPYLRLYYLTSYNISLHYITIYYLALYIHIYIHTCIHVYIYICTYTTLSFASILTANVPQLTRTLSCQSPWLWWHRDTPGCQHSALSAIAHCLDHCRRVLPGIKPPLWPAPSPDSIRSDKHIQYVAYHTIWSWISKPGRVPNGTRNIQISENIIKKNGVLCAFFFRTATPKSPTTLKMKAWPNPKRNPKRSNLHEKLWKT